MKKKNKEERKNLRFMVTKFAPKRKVTTKNGKEYVKAAKIQRLITPQRLRRKKVIKAIKKERVEAATKGLEEYKAKLKEFVNKKKNEKQKSKKEK
jgi:small subunit ribosomal protein S6e